MAAWSDSQRTMFLKLKTTTWVIGMHDGHSTNAAFPIRRKEYTAAFSSTNKVKKNI
jgi:hypothetical protein